MIDFHSPPAWLHEYAKALWPHVIADLELRGRMLLAQPSQAAMFCQCLAQYRLVTEVINCDGQIAEEQHGVTEKSDGYTVQKVHPAFRIQAELVRQAETLIHSLGLNEPLSTEAADAVHGLDYWLGRAMGSGQAGERAGPAATPPEKRKRTRRRPDLN